MLVATAKHDQTQKRVIQVALGVSFLLHALVMIYKWQPEIIAVSKRLHEKVTKIRLVEPEQMAESVAKTRTKIKTDVQRQIVTSEKSELDVKPVPTRFLSEQDQVVDRQTVAKQIGS